MENKKGKRKIYVAIMIIIIIILLLLCFCCSMRAKTLTISFGNKEETVKLKKDEKYELKTPKRDGYIFKEWVIDSGDVKIEDDVLIMGKEESSISVKWDLEEYTIEYDLNGGIVSSELVTKYNVETPSFDLPIPNKKDLAFIGWTGSNGNTPSMYVTIDKGSYGNKNYKANYSSPEVETYNIEYHLDGGYFPNGSASKYISDMDTFKLPTPSKNGYNFDGWYLTSDLDGEEQTKIEKGSTGDKEYYAKWVIATYTINYKLNGGKLKKELVTSYDINTPTFKLENPTKENYVFKGWKGTGISGTSTNVTISTGSYGNKSFEAVFRPIEYNIKYNLNGGSLGENTTLKYSVETKTFNLVAPFRGGYKFLGWYLDSEFTSEVQEKIEKGTIGDKEYFAKWEKETYTINYDLNDGIINGSNPDTYDVDTDSFTLINPTKEYYDFIGWSGTLLDGKVKNVTIEKGSFGNKELVANFEATKYSIKYNLNKGTEGANTLKSYTVETDTFNLVEPSRDGYTFDGWYNDSEFNSEKVISITKGSHGDREYYAKWDAIEYTITYHTNGGNLNDGAKVTYTADDETFGLEVPKKENYKFIGWYVDENLTNGIINKIEEGSFGNREYYAAWEARNDQTGSEVYEMMSSGIPSDGEQSIFVEDNNGVDFDAVSSLMNGNGLYYIESTKDDEYPIYYFRGDVDNNNIIVGNFCWKIVRTTEKGGIKLIYNGIANGGKCNNTGLDTQVANKIKFNSTTSRFESIGYAYTGSHGFGSRSTANIPMGTYFGHDVEYIDGKYHLIDTVTKGEDFNDVVDDVLEHHHYTCLSAESTSCSEVNFVYMERGLSLNFLKLSGGHTVEDVVDNKFFDVNNTTDSTIKAYIDNWYANNMTDYTYLLEDTVFCNDRTSPIKGGFDKDTTVLEKIVFGGTARNEENVNPSLVCSDPRDRFTVSTENGNGVLTYPVGLLTADEATYAGFSWWVENSNSYLDNGHIWWTMSPSRISANTIYIDVVYSILDNVHSGYTTSSSRTSGGVRPVIALKNGTKIIGGSGTTDNPYVIEY